MEITLAAEPSKMNVAESAPGLALATELASAVSSAPELAGLATHYFDWMEELVGKSSIQLVKPLLESSALPIRYEVAWWLSFRELDSRVMHELQSAMYDQTIEEWERSGARDRLHDIAQGYWLPKTHGVP